MVQLPQWRIFYSVRVLPKSTVCQLCNHEWLANRGQGCMVHEVNNVLKLAIARITLLHVSSLFN